MRLKQVRLDEGLRGGRVVWRRVRYPRPRRHDPDSCLKRFSTDIRLGASVHGVAL